jgi:hypothetical protein
MPYWTDSSGRVTLKISKALAKDASHQGDCEDSVREAMRKPYLAKQLDALNMDHVRAYLSELGAWDEDELEDEDMCKVRLVWLACGDINEGNY